MTVEIFDQSGYTAGIHRTVGKVSNVAGDDAARATCVGSLVRPSPALIAGPS